MKNYIAKDKGDGEDEGQLVDPAAAEAPPAFMEQFFSEIERVKNLIGRIKGATVQIKTLQDEALSAVGVEEEQQVSHQLATVLTQANKDAALAKRLLGQLKEETEKMSKQKGRKAQADIRVRDNIHATCLQNLVGTVRSYQQAQNEYKIKIQEKGVTVIKAVKPDASEEEVKAVLQGGDVNSVVRQALLQPGHDLVAQAYFNVVDKYQDVLQLEKSVEELHKMFVDMAVLVEAQGEMLDNIEHQVTMAKGYMESGNKQLQIALKARKQTRRRMCCCMVCVIVILVVILGPVLGVIK